MASYRTETETAARRPGSPASRKADGPAEYPVREYIGAMATELAQMARWDGDETLGRLLDGVAALAAERVMHQPVERVEASRPMPA